VLALLLSSGAALGQGKLLEQGKGLLGGQGGGLPGPADRPSSGGGLGAGLSQGQVGDGLREALRVGARRTVDRVGQRDGYNRDPAIHVPLPGWLGKARSGLALAGQAGLLDDLELRLNWAAEDAAPKAFDIFADAIASMSIDDARGILNGPQDAATQYFRRTTSKPLADAMRPVVQQSLSEVGAVRSFQRLSEAKTGLPLGQAAGDFNLTSYALEQAIKGLFHYIAKEEAAIRSNPAARSTALL